MSIFSRLANRVQYLVRPDSQGSAATGWGPSGWASPSDPLANPQDRLGDPLAAVTDATIQNDWRIRIVRGEYALPSWGLWHAIRLTPILGNYERLWAAALTGMDWQIKTVAEAADTATAEAQKKALQAAYDRIDVQAVIGHMARGNIYGYAVLSYQPDGSLSPLNPWNVARDGLCGDFFWNPEAKQCVTRSLPSENRMREEGYIRHEVEDNCAVEWLRLYLRIRAVEGFWDKNLESESKRQVVILLGTPPADKKAAVEAAANSIALGASGWLSKGPPDQSTEVLFPPASRGLPFYENRLRQLDEWACKTLFGAPLVALTAPDSGTLAGNAHAETARQRIAGAASAISATLQRTFDARVLRQAGLEVAGQRPLAYFELVNRRTVDPEKEVAWTATLAAAGIRRDMAELSERTGMKLSEAPPATPTDGPRADSGNMDGSLGLSNEGDGVPPVPRVPRVEAGTDLQAARYANRDPRAAAEALKTTASVQRLRRWDAPVREWFEALIAGLEAGGYDEAALAKLEEAIENMPPDLPDTQALARFLEESGAGAIVAGVKNRAKAAEKAGGKD